MEIRLKRINKTYQEEEVLQGSVIVNSSAETKVDGLVLSCEGSVAMQISNKSSGVFDAFYNTVNKPITLLNMALELLPAGNKIAAGLSEFPFEFPLKSKGVEKLYESEFQNCHFTREI